MTIAEDNMLNRRLREWMAAGFCAALIATMINGAAVAADEDKYPTNWKGQ